MPITWEKTDEGAIFTNHIFNISLKLYQIDSHNFYLFTYKHIDEPAHLKRVYIADQIFTEDSAKNALYMTIRAPDRSFPNGLLEYYENDYVVDREFNVNFDEIC